MTFWLRRLGFEDSVKLDRSVIFGRAKKCNYEDSSLQYKYICLKSTYISRIHCIITKYENSFEIKDIGSLNGTFIDNVKIRENETVELSLGNKIGIGVQGVQDILPSHFIFIVSDKSDFIKKEIQNVQCINDVKPIFDSNLNIFDLLDNEEEANMKLHEITNQQLKNYENHPNNPWRNFKHEILNTRQFQKISKINNPKTVQDKIDDDMKAILKEVYLRNENASYSSSEKNMFEVPHVNTSIIKASVNYSSENEVCQINDIQSNIKIRNNINLENGTLSESATNKQHVVNPNVLSFNINGKVKHKKSVELYDNNIAQHKIKKLNYKNHKINNSGISMESSNEVENYIEEIYESINSKHVIRENIGIDSKDLLSEKINNILNNNPSIFNSDEIDDDIEVVFCKLKNSFSSFTDCKTVNSYKNKETPEGKINSKHDTSEISFYGNNTLYFNAMNSHLDVNNVTDNTKLLPKEIKLYGELVNNFEENKAIKKNNMKLEILGSKSYQNLSQDFKDEIESIDKKFSGKMGPQKLTSLISLKISEDTFHQKNSRKVPKSSVRKIKTNLREEFKFKYNLSGYNASVKKAKYCRHSTLNKLEKEHNEASFYLPNECSATKVLNKSSENLNFCNAQTNFDVKCQPLPKKLKVLDIPPTPHDMIAKKKILHRKSSLIENKKTNDLLHNSLYQFSASKDRKIEKHNFTPTKSTDYQLQSSLILSSNTSNSSKNQETNLALYNKYKIIYDITSWNPVWLHKKDLIPHPQIHASMPLKTVNIRFNSFVEYYNVFYPLYLIELWEDIRARYESSCEAGLTKLIVKVLKKEVITINNLLKLSCLNCVCYLNKNDPDTIWQSGDFVIVEAQIKLNLENCVTHNDTQIKCFGYIYKYFVSFESSSKLYVVNCEILLKEHSFLKIENGKSVLLTKVAYIRPDINQYKSFITLAHCPLLPLVLLNDPKVISQSSSTGKMDSNLNKMQNIAATKILHSILNDPDVPNIQIVHGPPGTGKSYFLINTILEIIYDENRIKRNKKILVTAPSNAAIDELIRRLINEKQKIKNKYKNMKIFSFLRIGKSPSADLDVHSYNLENLLLKNMRKGIYFYDPENIKIKISSLEEDINLNVTKLSALKSEILKSNNSRKLRNEITKYENSISQLEFEKNNYQKKLSNPNSCFTSDELRRKEKELRVNLLQNVDIVLSTLKSCLTEKMDLFLPKSSKHLKHTFDCCIIDEAAQSTELETLIPLMYGIKKIILVGDPMQLPPVVKSRIALQYKYSQSFFERYCNFVQTLHLSQSPITLLNLQYRMHPEIALWPSHYFYKNCLESHASVSYVRECQLKPYIVIDVQNGEETKAIDGSLNNLHEALVTTEIIKCILPLTKNKNFSLGVITPYTNQKSVVKKKLLKHFHNDMNGIEVNTIDGFQGREKDIIILSCVRANSNQNIGFLCHPQRLNVALTRAKYSIIIVAHLLSLKELIMDADKRKVIYTITHDFENMRDVLFISNDK